MLDADVHMIIYQPIFNFVVSYHLGIIALYTQDQF